jgi:hypothetical protein
LQGTTTLTLKNLLPRSLQRRGTASFKEYPHVPTAGTGTNTIHLFSISMQNLPTFYEITPQQSTFYGEHIQMSKSASIIQLLQSTYLLRPTTLHRLQKTTITQVTSVPHT